ncbi:hypothetical protein KEM56_003508 [Ascosphaera pollenicola]|nr:hypothetical protein KEM56_003508 [Ascosphaera pollenicola]
MLVCEVQAEAASPAVGAIHGYLPILSTIILLFCAAESESKSKGKKRIDERAIPFLRCIDCRVFFKLYIAEIFMSYAYSIACSFIWATLLYTADCNPPLQPSLCSITALGFVAESVLMYFVNAQDLIGAVVVGWIVCEHVMEGSDVEKAALLAADGGFVVEKEVDGVEDGGLSVAGYEMKS